MSHGDPYQIILTRIHDGSYPVGARLPSERALAEEFGVHRTTIQRLITRLTAEGFVDRRPGCRPVVRGGADVSVQAEADMPVRGAEMPVRVGIVAVLISAGLPIVNNAYGAFLLGAQSVLRSEGYRMLFLSTSANGAADRYRTEHEDLRSLLADPVDGVILVPEDPEGSAPVLRDLVERGTAVVTADRWVDGLETDFVGVDNATGAAMAAEHLLSLGHSHIVFVDTPQNRYRPAEERKQGFLGAIRRHGIPVTPACVLDLPYDSDWARDTDFLRDWIARNGLPTGFVCVHDGVALCLARSLDLLGLNIPDDVSIVGFDDDAEKRNLGVADLTTVRQPFFHMGEDAANLLVARLRRPETPVHFVRLSPALVTRTSTQAPAGRVTARL